MSDGSIDIRHEARAKAYAEPLETLNPAQPALFQADAIWPYFERLRAEDPVHYTPESEYGPYWSITSTTTSWRWTPTTRCSRRQTASRCSSLDAEGRDGQAPARARASSPWTRPSTTCSARRSARSSRRPTWQRMEPLIRERAGQILDALPIGEEFDWVDLVSKELTTMTLATLFDFPFEERRKLTHWSDMMTNRARPRPGEQLGPEARQMLDECVALLHASCGTSGSNAPPPAT